MTLKEKKINEKANGMNNIKFLAKVILFTIVKKKLSKNKGEGSHNNN